MKAEISVLLVVLVFHHAHGHGQMYNPAPWQVINGCNPDPVDPNRCWYGLSIDCDCTGRCSDCSVKKSAFFTNYTVIPGEPSLQEELFDEWLPESRRKSWGYGFHPWNAPGSAPVFGNGCGVNGGNPEGCDNGSDMFGRCCANPAQPWDCGGYSGGKPALEHYRDGLFDYKGGPTETTWTRGEPAEVYWHSNAYHRGGYAYRLCRVHQKEYWKVTEECFQQGHLNFTGYGSMVNDNVWPYNPDGWYAIETFTTRIGTTPEGSEWAKINLPREASTSDNWAFKDLVDVPEDLEPGDYVLSFRWDCLESPQIWNGCANIKIV